MLRVLVAGFAVAVYALGLSQAASAQPAQKRVLTLYNTRGDSQIVVVGDRILQDTIAHGLPEGVDYFSEYLDQGRFFDTDYQTAFRDSLTLKYARYRFDAVVAIGDASIEFVARNQDGLFKDVPVVFFAERRLSRAIPNATGFVVETNFGGTVAFARALQPDLQHVFVVTSARGTFEGRTREQLRPFESSLEITYLSGLPTAAMESRLKALPPRSMVLYVNVDRVGTDQNFRPLDYLDRVTAVSNAPVYSWVDSAIDHGIVGGSLKSQNAEFKALSTITLRVLHGEAPSTIPVSSPSLDVLVADWRQLQRWGISESRLPVGTVVRFRTPSVWEQYGWYIAAAILGLVLQTALIVALVVHRRRRRIAERLVLEKQAALQSSYDRIQDLGRRLLKAQDAERAWLARELHDDVGQQLAALFMDLAVIERYGPGVTPEMLAEAVQRIQHIQQSTHDLTRRLHPVRLQLIGLIAALEELWQEFSQSGLRVSFNHAPVARAFTPDVTVCMFRVAQEALQNAVKHGGAHSVSVQLDATDELALSIEDDGCGFDPDASFRPGLGLISMRERVEALGGSFSVRSRKDRGTRIDVRVPLAAAAPQSMAVETAT